MDSDNTKPDEAARGTSKVQVTIQADSTVNYASYQNNVPLVRSLTITNTTDEALHGVEIAVRCEPEFADAMRLQFERLDAHETRRIDALDLKFQHRYLAELNEAERGRVIVQVPTGLEPDSPLEIEVIRALRDKGWVVHPQVGCSGYRIDMAIVHPTEQGTYLLGVECDGATYHSMPTARDRDRLRQLVLEGLGWTLHRIWSTDWWTDPEKEIQKLEAVISRQLLKATSQAVILPGMQTA